MAFCGITISAYTICSQYKAPQKEKLRTQNISRTHVPSSPPHMSLPYKYNEATIQSLNLVSELSSDSMDGLRIKQLEKCMEARCILYELEDPGELMIMIDALQRLGIDYHFEQDIKAVLAKQFGGIGSGTGVFGDNNLHDIALYFRLLRQAGYWVSTDVFDSFKDNMGHFKVELSQDIRGMMSLYEASHLRLKENKILDEAHDFAQVHLNASLMTLQPHLATAVKETLEHPYHKSMARFHSKRYLPSFHGTYGWMGLLTQLWTIDFNFVQCIHRQELLHISKWWNELGLSEELKFARNQPLKWYMWPMMILPDPRFSEHRIDMTKTISLVYLIDDIFDVRGTLDELVLFTEAINKWEPSATEQILPSYMKICFKVLDEITNEIADKVLREHGWNPTSSLRKAWGNLCNAFLVEAKWFASKQVPKANDYLENGVVSSGVHVVLLHAFFLLGEGITKETVDCMEQSPGPALMSSPATILRLWDDLGSAKDEEQDGHDGSYVECYLKEHKSSSIETAQEHVFRLISDSWKQLNREILSWSALTPSLVRVSLNSARMVRVMYSYDERQRLPALEEYINSLLLESIS